MTRATEAPRCAVVLLAAGQGRRVGAVRNKVFLPLLGRSVLAWSLETALRLQGVRRLVLVVRPQDREEADRILVEEFPGTDVLVVDGGETRHGSEWNAIQVLRPLIENGAVDVVAIHDTARPLAGVDLFRRVIAEAARHGGALPVVPQTELVTRATQGPPLDDVVAVQTPQAFRADRLLAAYVAAEADGFTGTDTASCVERYAGGDIRCVPSDAANLKITFPEDVAIAERLARLTLRDAPDASAP